MNTARNEMNSARNESTSAIAPSGMRVGGGVVGDGWRLSERRLGYYGVGMMWHWSKEPEDESGC